MYKGTSLTPLLQGEEQKNNLYVNVSKQEAQELALAVQEMYGNSGIPYQITKEIHKFGCPVASIALNPKGIRCCLGLKRTVTKITTITQKG